MGNKLAREAAAQMKKWKRETPEGKRFKSWETYHRKKYLRDQSLINPHFDVENLFYGSFQEEEI